MTPGAVHLLPPLPKATISPELQAAIDRYQATLYRTMPAWMRWVDHKRRNFQAWREHPYIRVPRWWPWQPKPLPWPLGDA